jgi:hypothetical protein
MLTAAVGAAMLFITEVAPAHRRAPRNCRARIEREEAKLARDIRRHELHHRQVEQRHIKLARLRRECRFSFSRLDCRERDRDSAATSAE